MTKGRTRESKDHTGQIYTHSRKKVKRDREKGETEARERKEEEEITKGQTKQEERKQRGRENGKDERKKGGHDL